MQFTPEILSPYLSQRLSGRVEVMDSQRFGRGSSRQTWFVTYRKDDGQPTEVVLRADFAAGSTEPTSLDREHFIYERLSRSAVPVAKVLWWENDPLWTDQPFYLREKVVGDWNIPDFSNPDPAFDELRVAIAQEHLRKLAIVHQVDWRALGFGEMLAVPRDEADAAHCYVRSLRQLYDEVVIEPIPIVVETCEWLHDHAPVAPRLSLCKGTNGHGEEVFRGREIVAMSDWEEVSIGDPTADFAFMQGFLFTLERNGQVLWNLDKALEFYRGVSGINVTAQSVGYYQVLRCLRLVIMMQSAARAVHKRAEPEIRQAWSATEVIHVCKQVLASAMGLMAPVGAARFADMNETVDMK